MTIQSEGDRIVSAKELRTLVPYHPVHIARLEKARKFPRRIQVGANRVGWSYREIQDWIADRKNERKASTSEEAES
jgi:prophage regulatory protein